jgi:hypothetical protein
MHWRISIDRGHLPGLGALAKLKLADGAAHSFHVLDFSGRSDADAMRDVLDA